MSFSSYPPAPGRHHLGPAEGEPTPGFDRPGGQRDPAVWWGAEPPPGQPMPPGQRQPSSRPEAPGPQPGSEQSPRSAQPHLGHPQAAVTAQFPLTRGGHPESQPGWAGSEGQAGRPTTDGQPVRPGAEPQPGWASPDSQSGRSVGDPQSGRPAGDPQSGRSAGDAQFGRPAADPQSGWAGADPQSGRPVVDPQFGRSAADPQSGWAGADPQFGQPASSSQSGWPAADPQSGRPGADPQSGWPAADPQSGRPSADPQSSRPGAEPRPGWPAADGQPGWPAADPQSGWPGADPRPGWPAAEPPRRPGHEPQRPGWGEPRPGSGRGDDSGGWQPPYQGAAEFQQEYQPAPVWETAPPEQPQRPEVEPISSALRGQIVDRMIRINTSHALQAADRLGTKLAVGPHCLALFSIETVPGRYQRLSTATRLILDGEDAENLPDLLRDLTARARERIAEAHAAGQRWEPRTPLTGLVLRSEEFGENTPYIGLGISTLDTPELPWRRAKQSVTGADGLHLRGQGMIYLNDDTAVHLVRRAQMASGQHEITASRRVDSQYPSRRDEHLIERASHQGDHSWELLRQLHEVLLTA